VVLTRLPPLPATVLSRSDYGWAEVSLYLMTGHRIQRNHRCNLKRCVSARAFLFRHFKNTGGLYFSRNRQSWRNVWNCSLSTECHQCFYSAFKVQYVNTDVKCVK